MTNFASKDLTAGQLNSLVKRAGGYEQVLRILSSELEIQLASMTAEAALVPESVEQFLTVEADISFEDRITCGHYSWRDSDLTEKRFLVTAEQVGDWEWKLFHFDRDISSEEAIRLMKEDGYDAGAIGHLLAFGEKYSKEQRKYPIIGLGFVSRLGVDCYRVPALLHSDREGYGLSTHCCDYGWHHRCRFLGVRRFSVA